MRAFAIRDYGVFKEEPDRYRVIAAYKTMRAAVAATQDHNKDEPVVVCTEQEARERYPHAMSIFYILGEGMAYSTPAGTWPELEERE